MCTTGQWIDSKLYQVIESYPDYYNYDLYIEDLDEDELYFLGGIPQVFKQYKNYPVLFTDEKERIVQLEGTIKDIQHLCELLN